jgi:malonate-semialdehyde dehydrogenase (acetylating)/methylmalonate-semialdehyde dehydrogenase
VPITSVKIFELLDQVGFPPGVLNMIHGGKDVVNALLEHPTVKGVSFVGSTTVGRHIYRTATAHDKRAQCQAGAKNSLVVMPDADMAKTVPNLLGSVFGCSGQRCLAGSILVPVGDAYEPLKKQFVEYAAKIKTGYGLDESAQMGPVASRKAYERILGYIETGVKEGGKLLLDGRNVKVDGFPEGCFIGPTVFDDTGADATIVKEEIFGPVACIHPVKTIDEAIEFINSSPYGNAGCLFTNDGRAARKFRYDVKAGNIGINVSVPASMAYFPFGGFKDSFFGDLHGQGRDVIQFFTESKVVITRWF